MGGVTVTKSFWLERHNRTIIEGDFGLPLNHEK
jgi:hypothetical protein